MCVRERKRETRFKRLKRITFAMRILNIAADHATFNRPTFFLELKRRSHFGGSINPLCKAEREGL